MGVTKETDTSYVPLTKWSSKSARVNCLAFHRTAPLLCAALRNGIVQVWNYSNNQGEQKLHARLEHCPKIPVRGVDIHHKKPLLVSGGDDCHVKLWNYESGSCLHTFSGHVGWIRSVQFHYSFNSQQQQQQERKDDEEEGNLDERPWILSASDDQTIRIWDFDKKICLRVLTGHNHFVMSAAFSENDCLIISASLDQTVRAWDVTGLWLSTAGESLGVTEMSQQKQTSFNQRNLLIRRDVIVKFVLEGHTRGVNGASFHPSLPLLASAADDRQVKIWRTTETKAWNAETLCGHESNVAGCIFHKVPGDETHYILSAGEGDGSIRMWSLDTRVETNTFRSDNKYAFRSLVAHRTKNLVAAAHESGFLVFELGVDPQQPAAASSSDKTLVDHSPVTQDDYVDKAAAAAHLLRFREIASQRLTRRKICVIACVVVTMMMLLVIMNSVFVLCVFLVVTLFLLVVSWRAENKKNKKYSALEELLKKEEEDQINPFLTSQDGFGDRSEEAKAIELL